MKHKGMLKCTLPIAWHTFDSIIYVQLWSEEILLPNFSASDSYYFYLCKYKQLYLYDKPICSLLLVGHWWQEPTNSILYKLYYV